MIRRRDSLILLLFFLSWNKCLSGYNCQVVKRQIQTCSPNTGYLPCHRLFFAIKRKELQEQPVLVFFRCNFPLLLFIPDSFIWFFIIFSLGSKWEEVNCGKGICREERTLSQIGWQESLFFRRKWRREWRREKCEKCRPSHFTRRISSGVCLHESCKTDSCKTHTQDSCQKWRQWHDLQRKKNDRRA